MTVLGGLNEDCIACGRRRGDHTLDELAVCVAKPTLDLPYEDQPLTWLTGKLGLSEDTVTADHIIVKSMVLRGEGPIPVTIPALLFEFSASPNTQEPRARVLFMGDEQTMRKIGLLVRDTANGAINAARKM